MVAPRKEVERLLTQARRDLRNAEESISIEAYEVVAFLCQQSVEKGLKAFYAHTRRKRPPAIHSLIELGRQLALPRTLLRPLTTMNPDYVVSRYPDAANGVPGEIYTEEMARERVEAAKEIWQWLEGQL